MRATLMENVYHAMLSMHLSVYCLLMTLDIKSAYLWAYDV